MENQIFLWEERNANVSLHNNIMSTKVLKRILANRGFTSKEKIDKFLNPKLEDLYSPFLLEDMEKVVSRIKKAINSNEKICIYGDYDVDGITSISVFLKYFKKIGYSNIEYYIPDRQDEGYGINTDALNKIIKDGSTLIISVDCGITSINEALFAKEKGVDLIITDHHNVADEIPNAYAIINPKKSTCKYPFTMLAGVGIVFKIVHALMGNIFFDFIDEIIDIVAFGTIADIAPLEDENRIIVKFGLEALNNTKNIGIKSLISVSELNDKKITSGSIGYILAPKINAAGRIDNPKLGVELFTTDSNEIAMNISKKLSELNLERQAREKKIFDEAVEFVENEINFDSEKILVIKGENWHEGIIGIVSSKISEKYYRPSIILNEVDGILKGSARSIGDFNIYNAMKTLDSLFLRFGGHKQAAGLMMKSQNYGEFRRKINEYADTTMAEVDLIPKIKYDVSLMASDITHELIDELEKLEPYGMGNPKPIFIYNNLLIDDCRKIGKDKNHLKLVVHDTNRVYDALLFSAYDRYDFLKIKSNVNLAFTLEKNSFRGVETLQFLVKDVKLSNVSCDENILLDFTEYIINNLSMENELEISKKLIQLLETKKIKISEMIFFIKNLLPTRDELVEIYRYIVKNFEIHLLESKISGILPYQIKSSIYILSENDILICSKEGYHYKCKINSKEKVDLFNSNAYKNIKKIQNNLLDFLKINKYI